MSHTVLFANSQSWSHRRLSTSGVPSPHGGLSENELAILTLLKPARNVVQLYGLCTNAWDGRLRLVLELCDHGNVREYVKALPRDKVI